MPQLFRSEVGVRATSMDASGLRTVESARSGESGGVAVVWDSWLAATGPSRGVPVMESLFVNVEAQPAIEFLTHFLTGEVAPLDESMPRKARSAISTAAVEVRHQQRDRSPRRTQTIPAAAAAVVELSCKQFDRRDSYYSGVERNSRRDQRCLRLRGRLHKISRQPSLRVMNPRGDPALHPFTLFVLAQS